MVENPPEVVDLGEFRRSSSDVCTYRVSVSFSFWGEGFERNLGESCGIQSI